MILSWLRYRPVLSIMKRIRIFLIHGNIIRNCSKKRRSGLRRKKRRMILKITKMRERYTQQNLTDADGRDDGPCYFCAWEEVRHGKYRSREAFGCH